MGEIKIIVKEPGKRSEMRIVENSLESMQKLVGGYIETVTLLEDLVLICNEEGKINDSPFNCNILGESFFGTLVFAGVDGEEFSDIRLTEDEFFRIFRL